MPIYRLGKHRSIPRLLRLLLVKSTFVRSYLTTYVVNYECKNLLFLFLFSKYLGKLQLLPSLTMLSMHFTHIWLEPLKVPLQNFSASTFARKVTYLVVSRDDCPPRLWNIANTRTQASSRSQPGKYYIYTADEQIDSYLELFGEKITSNSTMESLFQL